MLELARVPTEGEEWARRELERLLAARLRPVAIARFLAASQRRAGRVRRARPELVRREAAFAATGAAGWLVLAALDRGPFRPHAVAGLGGWAVTIAMLDWHLGMLETTEGEPCNLGPADAATLLRAWLAPAVAAEPSPLLCAIGFATDALDGPLARATRTTRLGRDLEGPVDAVFAAASLRGARRHGALTSAAPAAEALRLSLGLGYAVASYFGRARPPDAGVLRAARTLAPLRAVGVILAVGGHGRLGEPLLVGGSIASVLLVLRRAHSSPSAASRASVAAPVGSASAVQ